MSKDNFLERCEKLRYFIEEILKIKLIFNTDIPNELEEHYLKTSSSFFNDMFVTKNNKIILVFDIKLTDEDEINLYDKIIELDLNESIYRLINSINENNIKYLKHFPNLKYISFNINEVKIDTIDKSHLINYELIGISLESNSLSPDHLIGSLNSLKSLSFEGNSNFDANLTNHFKNVETLNINVIFKSEELELLQLPNLKIFDSTIVSINLKHLSKLTSISRLSISLIEDTETLCKKIKPLHLSIYNSNVVNLDLFNCSDLLSFNAINCLSVDIRTNLEKVESFEVINFGSKSKSKIIDISRLFGIESLTNVRLTNVDINIDYEFSIVNNSIKSFMAQGCRLTELRILTLLPKLESLDLSGNEIEDISYLSDIKTDITLNLSNNSIINIPPRINEKYEIIVKRTLNENNKIKGTDKKSYLLINNNPLISPPLEILQRGNSNIDSYYSSMVGETEELNEAKLIFLGNGEVGKTSLMKCLGGKCYDPEEDATHGINIQSYDVPINDQKSIKASIWDFGGQQIMHATHQLFLSRRCVYVLVINDRKEDLQQDQKIEYWLQQIKSFGGNSKVLIVRNKQDVFELNNLKEGTLREKFPNLVAIEPVSCKTGYNLERVRNKINEQIRLLPMRKVKLAKNWVEVKEEIKSLSLQHDHLPLSTFCDICLKHGVDDPEAQLTLRNLLHDLSVIIAFPEIAADFNMGILNPHWITDGIYTIINSPVLAKSNGYIKSHEIQKELDSVHPSSYTDKARFIIESMLQFELCHTIGNEKSKTYLVPNLLPTEIKDAQLNIKSKSIKFIFKYENLLPPSLFPKFLVRMNQDIKADRRWRTGAILSDVKLNAQAKVEEDSVARTITIEVTGEQVRDYFAIIRKTIHNLNSPDEAELGVDELIPLPRYPNNFVSYQNLIGHEVKKRDEYFDGTIGQGFDVSKLLSGIESRDETAKAIAEQKEHVTVVNNNNINIQNDNSSSLTSSNNQEQTATQTATQTVDISIELKNLKGTADYVLEDLVDDAEDEIENEREFAKVKKDCEKVTKAVNEIQGLESPEQADEKVGSFSRISDFLTGALDGSSRTGETLELLGDTVNKVRGLAKKYNTVASYFGMPVVPEVLL